MSKIIINTKDFDKFIFKGSLALESYYDVTNNNEEIFDQYNLKLRKYRELPEKNNESKEIIVNELISTIEKIGLENFIIYEDGDVEYNYNKIVMGDEK